MVSVFELVRRFLGPVSLKLFACIRKCVTVNPLDGNAISRVVCNFLIEWRTCQIQYTVFCNKKSTQLLSAKIKQLSYLLSYLDVIHLEMVQRLVEMDICGHGPSKTFRSSVSNRNSFANVGMEEPTVARWNIIIMVLFNYYKLEINLFIHLFTNRSCSLGYW